MWQQICNRSCTSSNRLHATTRRNAASSNLHLEIVGAVAYNREETRAPQVTFACESYDSSPGILNILLEPMQLPSQRIPSRASKENRKRFSYLNNTPQAKKAFTHSV